MENTTIANALRDARVLSRFVETMADVGDISAAQVVRWNVIKEVDALYNRYAKQSSKGVMVVDLYDAEEDVVNAVLGSLRAITVSSQCSNAECPLTIVSSTRKTVSVPSTVMRSRTGIASWCEAYFRSESYEQCAVQQCAALGAVRCFAPAAFDGDRPPLFVLTGSYDSVDNTNFPTTLHLLGCWIHEQ